MGPLILTSLLESSPVTLPAQLCLGHPAGGSCWGSWQEAQAKGGGEGGHPDQLSAQWRVRGEAALSGLCLRAEAN